MTRNLLYIIISLSIIIILDGCSSTEVEEQAESVTVINPNGVSELASLMREMQSHAQIMRSEMRSGTFKTKGVPENFKELKTAKPTRPEQKDESYEGFADAFMNAMQQYYDTEVPHLLRYKRVIETCVACHKRLCPGPVKLIEKLHIVDDPKYQDMRGIRQ